MTLHEVVEDGEGHIGTECRCTIAQQQGGMHRLTNLTTLNNQRRLHTLTHTNQIVVNSTHSQQGWDSRMIGIHITVGKDDIVVTLVHALLCIMTEFL